MKSPRRLNLREWCPCRGQSIAEYVLIIGLVSLASLAALTMVAGDMDSYFDKSGKHVSGTGSAPAVALSNGPGYNEKYSGSTKFKFSALHHGKKQLASAHGYKQLCDKGGGPQWCCHQTSKQCKVKKLKTMKGTEWCWIPDYGGTSCLGNLKKAHTQYKHYKKYKKYKKKYKKCKKKKKKGKKKSCGKYKSKYKKYYGKYKAVKVDWNKLKFANKGGQGPKLYPGGP